MVSGALTVMAALLATPRPKPPRPPRPPPEIDAITAVSRLLSLPMVMVWPGLKPAALSTGMTVAPASAAVRTVVAPGVPTLAMTALSRLSPRSMLIVWPGPKPATLATLTLVCPGAKAIGMVVVACKRKSVQLLSVSAPSGKRPTLRSPAVKAAAGPKPRPAPGEGTRQPACPAPDDA